MFTQITKYMEAGRTFLIYKDTRDAHFWAVEDKYIDSEGKTTKVINGLEGHRNDNIKDTIAGVHFQIIFEGYMEQGVEMMEALELTAEAVKGA